MFHKATGVYHGPHLHKKARPPMSDTTPEPPPGAPGLPAAARRALAEAEERRRQATPPLPKELGGRDGPEPVRYGDWEKKGLAIDF